MDERSSMADDLSSDVEERRPWYQDPHFSRYWSHYDQCMNWMRTHNETQRPPQGNEYLQWCQSMASYHTQCAEWMHRCSMYWMQAAQKCFTQPSVTATHAPSERHRQRASRRARSPATASDTGDSTTQSPPKKSRKARKRKRQHKKRKEKQRLAIQKKKTKSGRLLFSDLEDIPSDLEFVLDLSGDLESGCGVDGVEYHMEITEEMLEFFAQSAKHKQERDAKKKATDDNTVESKDREEDFTDLACVSAHRAMATSTAAPREQPGVRRSGEMGKIYGTGAPMIHAMETAMQLTYHRNCDRKQPKLWPNLPLNIKFN